MDFEDRNVIVTGGSGALGGAVVRALIAAGARCRLAVRSEQDVGRSPWRSDSRVEFVACGDLQDERAAAMLFDAVQPWASIHVAGGFAFGALAETEPSVIREQIDMNLMSCLFCCRAAAGAMQRTGKGGRIVNVAARPALEWRDGASKVAYTAAKAGVAALTVALAEEVVRHDILVNAVAPSIMDTPANRAAMPKAKHADWPKPEEVAATILFLASPENKVTRGAVVPVYGRS
jgi:NAD(P)-dependent dehydrogenase (short-subunit alcohol dehydrogenase family)